MVESDLELLAEMRVRWWGERTWWEQAVRNACTHSEVTVTGRVKNLGTLREKLHRMNGGLSTVRDVVGIRVVAHGGRFEQLWALADTCGLAKDHSLKLIDRIEEPRCGYRALHVEVRRDGIKAEIQVRSRLQHEWAEAMERFADKAGRDVRYVDGYDFPKLSGETRELAITCHRYMAMWAGEIDRFERNSSPESQRSYVEYLGGYTKSKLEEFDEQLL